MQAFSIVQNLITLAGYAALLVGFSGFAVLALVLAAIPATVAEARFSGAAFRLRNWRSPEARRLNYLEYVLANDGHVKEVKLFGLGPMFLERYKALATSFYREDSALAVRRAGCSDEAHVDDPIEQVGELRRDVLRGVAVRVAMHDGVEHVLTHG